MVNVWQHVILDAKCGLERHRIWKAYMSTTQWLRLSTQRHYRTEHTSDRKSTVAVPLSPIVQMSRECNIKIKSKQNAKVWYSLAVWAVYPLSVRIVRYENKLVDCESKSIVSTYNLMLLLFCSIYSHIASHSALVHTCEAIPCWLRFAKHCASVESTQWSQTLQTISLLMVVAGCCWSVSHTHTHTQHNGQICRSIEIQLVAFDPKVIRLPSIGTSLSLSLCV